MDINKKLEELYDMSVNQKDVGMALEILFRIEGRDSTDSSIKDMKVLEK